MGERVVLAGACRTAIGKMGGALKEIPAADLGAIVIREAVKRAGIAANQVDEVLLGCVLQTAQGQNVARQAAVSAGLPYEVPATTVNNVCGSSLKCVNMAAAMIKAGEAEIVVAGGTESMSRAAFALTNARFGYRINHGKLLDTMVHDALWDAFHDYHMGITAENICDRWGLKRPELDLFAAASQNKAEAAQSAGKFQGEIVPIEMKSQKDTWWFAEDEGVREHVTESSLAKLKPAFKADGMVTAGNSSTINDGAAAVVVMSERKARELGIKPMAEWVAGASAGVEPEIMGIGPVAATRKALGRAGLSIGDIDLIEANEAFAAQALAVARELGLEENRLNVNGGAISLGHPVGASGCRILVTLLHEMARQKDKNLGLATLCVGGGMGVSAIVKAIREA